MEWLTLLIVQVLLLHLRSERKAEQRFKQLEIKINAVISYIRGSRGIGIVSSTIGGRNGERRNSEHG